MLVRDLLFVYCLQHLHGRHDAQDAVIVAAVLDRVHVRRHNDTLGIGVAAGKCGIHIRHIVDLNHSADRLHASAEFVSCLNGCLRQRIPCDAAVTCVTEF